MSKCVTKTSALIIFQTSLLKWTTSPDNAFYSPLNRSCRVYLGPLLWFRIFKAAGWAWSAASKNCLSTYSIRLCLGFSSLSRCTMWAVYQPNGCSLETERVPATPSRLRQLAWLRLAPRPHLPSEWGPAGHLCSTAAVMLRPVCAVELGYCNCLI